MGEGRGVASDLDPDGKTLVAPRRGDPDWWTRRWLLASIPVAGAATGATVGFLRCVEALRPGGRLGALGLSIDLGAIVVAFGWAMLLAGAIRSVLGFASRSIERRWGEGEAAARPRPSPRGRAAWLVGLGVVGALAGFGGATAVMSRTLRELHAVVARLDAVDPGWRLGDLASRREEGPGEADPARIVGEAAAKLGGRWPAGEVEDAWRRLRDLDETKRLDDATADALRAELGARGESLAVARRVAAGDPGHPRWKLATEYADVDLFDAEAARQVARLLGADAAAAAQDGDPDRALRSCRAVFGVARSLGERPSTALQLLRTSIDSDGAAAVRRVLAQGEPSAGTLEPLQRLILEERGEPRLRHALRGERAWRVEMIRWVGSLDCIAYPRGERVRAIDGLSRPLDSAGLLARQVIAALDWYDELIAIASRPEPEWIGRLAAWESRLAEVGRSPFAPFTAGLPLLLRSDERSVFLAELRLRAELGATALLIAAERHRQATGAWPVSLDDIDEAILPEAPLDPFSGEAYRMQHRDGQLRIYSVGPNLRDEGGAYDDAGAVGYDPALRGRTAGDGG